MNLKIISGEFSICKITNIADAPIEDDFWFLSRTDEELSLVCRTESMPDDCTDADSGWSMFRVCGVLDFSLTGILSRLSGVLAEAGIGIFAVSTFNTDYILVKTENLSRTTEALRAAGYTFE